MAGSNGTRMAGEALTDDIEGMNNAAEATDVAEGNEPDDSAKAAGYRNALERNIGTEEYERIGAEGADALDDKGRYQAREVISEYRNSGKSIDEMTDYFQGLADDGTKFNNRARDFLAKKGVTFGGAGEGGGGGDDPVDEGGTNPADPADPPNTTQPAPEDPPRKIQPIVGPTPIYGGGDQNQTVNQDNDINTNINGDNNNTNIDQDNSVRQYGGAGSWTNAWMQDYFS